MISKKYSSIVSDATLYYNYRNGILKRLKCNKTDMKLLEKYNHILNKSGDINSISRDEFLKVIKLITSVTETKLNKKSSLDFIRLVNPLEAVFH